MAAIAFHRAKKLTKEQWVKIVNDGKLAAAIRKVHPVKADGPWHVLCDNEGFLTTGVCSQAHRRAGVKLWRIPPRSPDCNPIERFWAWLKKKLRRMDLADLQAVRRAMGRVAYTARVKRVLRSKKAQDVAAADARSLRKVCKQIVKRKGAASDY